MAELLFRIAPEHRGPAPPGQWVECNTGPKVAIRGGSAFRRAMQGGSGHHQGDYPRGHRGGSTLAYAGLTGRKPPRSRWRDL